MHTDSSDKEEGIHGSYESAVDQRLDASPRKFKFTYDGEDPTRAGSRTRAVARRAHKSYWALVNSYDANGYTRRVHRITKRQLNRAANALADVIR